VRNVTSVSAGRNARQGNAAAISDHGSRRLRGLSAAHGPDPSKPTLLRQRAPSWRNHGARPQASLSQRHKGGSGREPDQSARLLIDRQQPVWASTFSQDECALGVRGMRRTGRWARSALVRGRLMGQERSGAWSGGSSLIQSTASVNRDRSSSIQTNGRGSASPERCDDVVLPPPPRAVVVIPSGELEPGEAHQRLKVNLCAILPRRQPKHIGTDGELSDGAGDRRRPSDGYAVDAGGTPIGEGARQKRGLGVQDPSKSRKTMDLMPPRPRPLRRRSSARCGIGPVPTSSVRTPRRRARAGAFRSPAARPSSR
jgi:hypothetical protein